MNIALIKRCIRWIAVVCGIVFLTGCMSFYVDNATKEIPSSQFKRPAVTQPVQLLFQFQTRGVANERATNSLKARVFSQVSNSGLFSSVSEVPVANSSLLTITINNVPTDDSSFRKGFATGLTFGLVGNNVSDGYVGEARWTPAGGQPVSVLARHAIHTSMGVSSDPNNATKMGSISEAVDFMLRGLVSTLLRDLSNQATFK